MSGNYRGPTASIGADARNIDGDKGDITVTNSGVQWTIDPNVVTYAKLQDASTGDVLLGRDSTGTGDYKEIPLTTAGRALLDDVNATAQRTTLGLGTAATTSSNDYLKPVDIGLSVLAYDANLQGFVNTFTLPTVDGATGQVLSTNSAGTLGFITVGGTQTAATTSSTPSGNLVATNVQSALTELDADLTSHITSITAHPASSIVNTASGNISAVTVQAALNELDVEKANLAGGNTFAGVQVFPSGQALIAPVLGTPTSGTLHNCELKTNTALADAAATLTAAQLRGGEFTITPTAARILTLDTAANIIANLTGSVDNSNYEITIVNLAAFNVTLAIGTGVTIVGRAVINNGSATFRVRRLTSTTVEVKRLEGVLNQAIGVGQTWQDVTASRALGTTYTNSTGRPIFVLMSVQAAAAGEFQATVVVGGLGISLFGGTSGANARVPVSFIVSPGANYSVTNTLNSSITRWSEII